MSQVDAKYEVAGSQPRWYSEVSGPAVDSPSRAPVAQWIERWVPDPKVAGSSPVGRAIVGRAIAGRAIAPHPAMTASHEPRMSAAQTGPKGAGNPFAHPARRSAATSGGPGQGPTGRSTGVWIAAWLDATDAIVDGRGRRPGRPGRAGLRPPPEPHRVGVRALSARRGSDRRRHSRVADRANPGCTSRGSRAPPMVRHATGGRAGHVRAGPGVTGPALSRGAACG